MSRWFRFYDCALDDPKVQRLPADLFKTWVNLLCVASRNDGKLPDADDLAFLLRLDGDVMRERLGKLEGYGLIDRNEVGTAAPHNWDKRQHKSDDSAERVRRFREKQKQNENGSGNDPDNGPGNGRVTVTVTAPDTETDTETDTEQKEGESAPDGAAPSALSGDVLPFPKAKTKPAKGTRLSDDWKPNSDLIEFARNEGLTDDQIRRELASFRDYFLAASGPNAVKRDWNAAGRNWLRKAAGGFGSSRGPAPGGHGTSSSSRFAAMQRAVARFDD